jgi:DNA-binding MarR family transcriptional regulator
MPRSSRDIDPVADAVERHSRALFVLSVRAMEAAEDPLGPSELRALLALDTVGSCSLGELAHQLSRSQSASSRLVDRLVARGLVAREAAPGNRRQLRISATPAGHRRTVRLVRRRRDAIAEVVAAMTPADRQRLQDGLAAFSAASPAGAVTGAGGATGPRRPARRSG